MSVNDKSNYDKAPVTPVVTTAEVQVEVQRALRTFKAFEHAAKIINYMAGLEQNERETLARIDAAKAKADQAVAESQQRIGAAHSAAGEAEAAAALAGRKTAREADELLQHAKETAATTIAQAESKAATLAEIIAARQIDADNLAKQVESARNELADIEAKIDAAQKHVAKILGA